MRAVSVSDAPWRDKAKAGLAYCVASTARGVEALRKLRRKAARTSSRVALDVVDAPSTRQPASLVS